MNALAGNPKTELHAISYLEIVRRDFVAVYDKLRPIGRRSAGLLAVLSIKLILVWALVDRLRRTRLAADLFGLR